MSNKASVYFPNLNGLRFFAALIVVLTHVELIKQYIPYTTNCQEQSMLMSPHPIKSIMLGEIKWFSPLITQAGGIGVNLFFVLSGFLITYLLFVEKRRFGTIAIKAFYIRRILRIWPLYYLLVLLGFFILPNFALFSIPDQDPNVHRWFWHNFLPYFFLFPNLALSMFMLAAPNIGQLWSIGVEEQFYGIWPWIIRKSKNFIQTIFWFIVFLLIIKGVVLYLADHSGIEGLRTLKRFMAMLKLESMALGAVGAWLIFEKKESLLKIVYHPVVFWGAMLGIPISVYIIPAYLQTAAYLPQAVMSLVIILNLATNVKYALTLENKVLDWLGKISYGIYGYHMLIVTLVLNLAKHGWHWGHPQGSLYQDLTVWQNVVIYTLVIILTIGVASISYLYFELPFIRRKARSTKVVSGEKGL